MRARASVRSSLQPPFAAVLDLLENFYGPQTPAAPTDPYLFLLWWQCGYPPSEERCAKGFEALQRDIGLTPADLLGAGRARLARALKAGGMVPELRAARLKEVAQRVTEEFAAGLQGALQELPLAKARAALRKFPGIGVPGAERILLFAGVAPVAAVPSNCPYVPVRIASGQEPGQYSATYAQAQKQLAQLPETLQARSRAYLLLQRHGRELCKRTRPRCDQCPLARRCRFNLSAAGRPGSAPPSRR